MARLRNVSRRPYKDCPRGFHKKLPLIHPAALTAVLGVVAKGNTGKPFHASTEPVPVGVGEKFYPDTDGTQ